MGNQHEPQPSNIAAEAFLAGNMARRLRPCSRYVGIPNRWLIVANRVNRILSPDADGLGAQRWEDFNPRFTVYLPLDVRAELEDEAVRSGLSKTRLVVAAIRAYLDGPLDE